MRSMKAFPPCLLAGALLCSTVLLCGPGLIAQSSAAAPRITTDVDESSLATLKGNVPGLARRAYDQGEASPATQLTNMRLLLSRTSQQEAALEQYLVQLQDKSSPNFHKWLTPAEFGQLYGPADSDVSALVAWLQSQGFTVETVSKGRTNIAFSGSVSQVEAAFHTSIHSFSANGTQFYSNTTDPRIPSALASVVMGVAHLNTIRPMPQFIHGNAGRFNPETKRLEPLNPASDNQPKAGFTGGSGTNSDPYVLYIVPGDAATIYDTPNSFNAKFSGGTSYTGAGVTIGIGGAATIDATIVASGYRSAFLESPYVTAPTLNYCTTSSSCSSTPASPVCSSTQTSGCYDNADDAGEAYLDNELSGGMAPGATIDYYASTDLNTGIEAALDANLVDIFSLSFGLCEQDLSTSDNALINGWWQQAAGEGIAVTVSAGDNGSAGCDATSDSNGNNIPDAVGGLQVSGFASTPYNIAVGGTDFYSLINSFSNYVNTASQGSSSTYYRTALSYIPESTWNDSTYNYTTISQNEPLSAAGFPAKDNNIVAGSGGASNCSTNTTVDTSTTYTVGNCTSGYSKPSWQTGAGVPADGARDLPDVSLMAGNGFYFASWLVCDDTTGTGSTGQTVTLDCETQSDGNFYFDAYGGTSAAAPSFAGILALVEQKTGGRLGQAAQTLYALYNSNPASAAFHDVTEGNNSVPCNSGTPDCAANSLGYYYESGYNTTAGYDLATGLGSVDATKLITNWSAAASLAAPTVAMTAPTPNPVTTIESLSVSVSVAGSGAAPTGTVTLVSGSYTSTQTLGSGGCTASDCAFTIPAGSLAIGTATLTGNYSGDSNYAAATNSTTVTVNGLTASVTASSSAGSITPNQTVTVSGTVSCTGSCTGAPPPTGTVTLTGGGYTSAATTINISTGSYAITIPSNSLSAGTDTLTVTYGGNSTYDAATNSTTVTVNKLTASVTATSSAGSINSNQVLTVTGAVSCTGSCTGAPPPTGTVTLTGGGYTSAPATLSSGSYSITIPANTFSASGNVTLTVTYSGDSTYDAGAAGTASVQVTYVAILTPTVTVTPASNTVDSSQTLNVTVTVTGSGVTPTGTITLSGSYGTGAMTLGTTGCTAGSCVTITIPANILTTGTDTLNANYSGDANYAPSVGTATVTVTQSVFALQAANIASLAPGGTSGNTSTVTVSSSTGYVGTVTLACALTSSPTGATDLPSCSVTSGSPVTLSSTTTSGTATVTVSTTAASSAALAYPKLPGKGRGWEGAGGGAVLAFLLFLGIPARRRSWRSMLGILVMMAALGSLAACGGGSSTTTPPGNPGTTAGTYTFTVTGTGNPAVTPAPTTMFTATVN